MEVVWKLLAILWEDNYLTGGGMFFPSFAFSVLCNFVTRVIPF